MKGSGQHSVLLHDKSQVLDPQRPGYSQHKNISSGIPGQRSYQYQKVRIWGYP